MGPNGSLVGYANPPGIRSGGDAPVSPAPVPRISGAQIDQMQRAVRATGLAPAEWLSVLRTDDETRAVVHVRRGDEAGQQELRVYCATANAAIAEHLLPGQKVELYVIEADGVPACR